MRSCKVCENQDFTLIATQIREGEGRIMECNHCGLVIQDLDWDDKQLKDYYEKEYQQTNSLVDGEEQSPQAHFDERIQTIQPIFEQIKPLLSKDKIVLEVGGGTGELLFLCKPLVKKCVGVEINSSFVRFMNESLEIEAYAEDINKLKLEYSFDLIIISGTLDHLHNPLETLKTLKSLLAKNGKIYLEVPNRNEALNFYLPEPQKTQFNTFFWHRAHLFYFTKETITALFKKVGLQIDISCRHNYTLKNYLSWYFRGKPQKGLVEGQTNTRLFDGESDFEVKMNDMFEKMEHEFQSTMAETFRGESLCCIGWM